MTSGGAEALKAALRRSFPILIGFVILGIAAVSAVKQLQGPQYEATVNAVASAYVAYQANLSASGISGTISRIQATLAGLPTDSPQRGQLQSQLNKLSVLQSVNSSDAVVVQRATGADKTSPSPAKDS